MPMTPQTRPDAPPVARPSTYLGLFLVTLATLAYQILLTRIFSVTIWYHFAFLAISIAMLGMTMPDIDRWSDRVITVLGQNPGPFTGPGTNTYIVGTGRSRLLLEAGQGVDKHVALLDQAIREQAGGAAIRTRHGSHRPLPAGSGLSFFTGRCRFPGRASIPAWSVHGESVPKSR